MQKLNSLEIATQSGSFVFLIFSNCLPLDVMRMANMNPPRFQRCTFLSTRLGFSSDWLFHLWHFTFHPVSIYSFFFLLSVFQKYPCSRLWRCTFKSFVCQLGFSLDREREERENITWVGLCHLSSFYINSYEEYF